MKKNIILIAMLIATVFSNASAIDTNGVSSSCDAKISIRLKVPEKIIRTNEPVILVLQIQNTSTNNTLLFQINNLSSDFSWIVTSPSGKDLSPKHPSQTDAFASSFPKLKPTETWEGEFDLSSVCRFGEVGTYKVIVQKEVFRLLPERKKCEIVSGPLNIIVSK